MYNINYNNIKKSKKQYSINLRNMDNNSYRLYEKISFSLNHSLQSNGTETAASKSNLTKTFSSRNPKLPVNENQNYPIKKCSYTKFLELRNTKNSVPFGNTEQRFKWQNLKNENIVVYPEIYKKPHKKQFLLKETFGEGMLDFINYKKTNDDKPKIRRIRRCLSEQNLDKPNYIQNIDINISKRVIDPSYNKEPEKKIQKKSFSQSNFNYHKTDGGLKSLFDLTPIDIPIKGKKLYNTKSYGAININLFDKNYGQFEMPTHTKKQFFNNRCYFDHIKDEDLISYMNKCWKFKRSKSAVPRFKTDLEIYLNNNVDQLQLRNNINNNINKSSLNKSLSKIKRNNRNNKNEKYNPKFLPNLI